MRSGVWALRRSMGHHHTRLALPLSEEGERAVGDWHIGGLDRIMLMAT